MHLPELHWNSPSAQPTENVHDGFDHMIIKTGYRVWFVLFAREDKKSSQRSSALIPTAHGKSHLTTIIHLLAFIIMRLL